MKIAVKCDSLLLEKSLNIFLEPYIVPKKQCDFIVSDYEFKSDKPLFLIGSPNLPKPFSKVQLLNALQKFNLPIDSKKRQEKFSDTLEEKIDILTQEFRENLIKTIRNHYEN